MTENIENIVHAAQGQGPSPDFVARLRAQIVAETEGSGSVANGGGRVRTADALPNSLGTVVDEPDDDTALVIELGPGRRDKNDFIEVRNPTQRGAQLLAVAAVVAVVFIGMWVILSFNEPDPEEVDTVDTPTPTTEVSDSNQNRGAAPLTADNTVFEPGTHRIDTLGTAFTFSVEEMAGVLVNSNGVVSITDLSSDSADDRTITFRRTPFLPHPSAPTAVVDQTTGWPATDLVGWLEATGDEIMAGEPTATTLGGFDATFVELEFPCPVENCVAPATPSQGNQPVFNEGSLYRLGVVDQGPEDPIVVVVAIDDVAEAAWFDEADALLSSLSFEAIEPNPVKRALAGLAELAVFDGVLLDLPEAVVIVEPFGGFARIFPPQIGGDVEFLTRPLDTNGVEVTTVDGLLQLLGDEAVVVTELDTSDIGGVEARVFEVASGPFPNIVLKARTADLARTEFGWESPELGHLWVIEHPSRGLLIVSAEALAGPGAVEPLRQWTDGLLRTLEFRER
ncbi:MAG: hypothetical protein R8J94_21500 [Acidimicrobiia bacterium]|nr:hypothetical protein [Acidimicrobiia bacterium]